MEREHLRREKKEEYEEMKKRENVRKRENKRSGVMRGEERLINVVNMRIKVKRVNEGVVKSLRGNKIIVKVKRELMRG